MVRILLTFFIIFPLGIFAQIKEKVEVIPQILGENLTQECKTLELGKIIFFYEPDFPAEAQDLRTGGIITAVVKVDETGNIGEISSVKGNLNFREIAEKAAQKVKFSPTICDGNPISVSALMTYNFIPKINVENYFSPTNIGEFTDIENTSPYYESVKNLTDNYKIGFGYSDNKFHENAPLTRGDFAHFLRLTIDLLFKRAKESNKLPNNINLIRVFNPQNVNSVNLIKDIDKKQPFYRSVGILLQTYNIALVNKELKFQNTNPMTTNEIIDLWTNIFGKETVPVNFEKTQNGEQIFTRGEFALFLNESMQVLSYKVLP